MTTGDSLVMVACAAVIVGLGGFSYGQKITAERLNALHEKTLASINAEHTKQLAIATDAVRTIEQARAAAAAAIDKQLLEKQQNEIISRDRLIAGLRNDTVQLRKRFTCNTGTSGEVPSNANTTGSSDGAQAGGLQKQDAEFLVRLADDADQVALQLQACQEFVNLTVKGK